MIYPDYDEFNALKEKYDKITVYKKMITDTITPINLLVNFQNKESLFLLESVKTERFSFLGFDVDKIIIGKGDRVIIKKNDKEKIINQNIIDYITFNYQRIPQKLHKRFGNFAGGLVGFFGYETVNFTGLLRNKIKYSDSIHSIVFEVNRFFVFDNYENSLYLAVCIDKDTSYFEAVEKLDDLEKNIYDKNENYYFDLKGYDYEKEYSDKDFLEKIKSVKNEIINGEAIQVVLSRKYIIHANLNPVTFYRSLRKINPSPYMFYIKFKDIVITGSSPETHLKVKDKIALLKPIAGTYPVNKNPEDLLSDEKEISEHLMLLDLARNDLYQGCEIDSVNVKKSFSIEKYSHVIHIVSEVEGNLKKDYSPFKLFLKTFPAGTVSGAPKVRAIEIIDEYEESERGFYSGCVGYINYNHSLDTSITIRSAMILKDRAIFRAGAGIVAYSVPENELEEIEKKLKALFTALEKIKEFEVKNVFIGR